MAWNQPSNPWGNQFRHPPGRPYPPQPQPGPQPPQQPRYRQPQQQGQPQHYRQPQQQARPQQYRQPQQPRPGHYQQIPPQRPGQPYRPGPRPPAHPHRSYAPTYQVAPPGYQPRGGKKSPGVAVLVGIGITAVTLIGIASIVDTIGDITSEPTPRPTQPVTSRTRPVTLPPPTRPASTRPPVTTPPATTPAAPRTTTQPPSSTSPPPPKPTPIKPSPTVNTYKGYPYIANSPLYRQKMGTWACQAISNPQVPPSGDRYERYVNGIVDCMMAHYRPVFRAVGKNLPRPRIAYFRNSVNTPCGTWSGSAGFYCSGNQTIYTDSPRVATYDDHVRLGGVQLLVHEFNHHVQHQFNLMNGPMAARLESPNQIARRMELQAQCLSWIQITQLTNPRWTAEDAEEMARWQSEDQDALHGTGASNTYWYLRGRGQTNLSVCNTWIAQNGRVA